MKPTVITDHEPAIAIASALQGNASVATIYNYRDGG